MFMRQLAGHVVAAHTDDDVRSLTGRADALDQQADRLREMVTNGAGFTPKE
jgi:hypothetical protein